MAIIRLGWYVDLDLCLDSSSATSQCHFKSNQLLSFSDAVGCHKSSWTKTAPNHRHQIFQRIQGNFLCHCFTAPQPSYSVKMQQSSPFKIDSMRCGDMYTYHHISIPEKQEMVVGKKYFLETETNSQNEIELFSRFSLK